MPALRSRVTTHGRNAAGARSLWRATGMGDDDFGKPIVAIANSYTQFVPGHVHPKDLGQLVAVRSRRPAARQAADPTDTRRQASPTSIAGSTRRLRSLPACIAPRSRPARPARSASRWATSGAP